MRAALVVRLDSMGDVLISGPAIRAVAASADRVAMLVGPRGADAARLLPGVDDILVWDCPWIAWPAPEVRDADVTELLGRLRGYDEALILTSFHQSALPTALLLRLGGVPRIAAISDDYPGSLLDVRVASPADAPESQRMLAVARAAGYELPPADDGLPRAIAGESPVVGRYVVVHPGADGEARRYPADRWREVVTGLTASGRRVVVTGSAGECDLTAYVAADAAADLGGAADLAGLTAVLGGADVVVAANTGPAHLAAAVGTPVVSLYAPVVPAVRWAPYGAPTVVLGDQRAPCANTRARSCPVPGHPCLSKVTVEQVIAAVDLLVPLPVEARV